MFVLFKVVYILVIDWEKSKRYFYRLVSCIGCQQYLSDPESQTRVFTGLISRILSSLNGNLMENSARNSEKVMGGM